MAAATDTATAMAEAMVTAMVAATASATATVTVAVTATAVATATATATAEATVDDTKSKWRTENEIQRNRTQGIHKRKAGGIRPAEADADVEQLRQWTIRSKRLRFHSE